MLRLSGQQASTDAWDPRLEENPLGLSLDVTMMGRTLRPLSQLLCLAQLSVTKDMFSVCCVQHGDTGHM